MSKYYLKKLILSGKFVELITYKKPVFYGSHRAIDPDDYICKDIIRDKEPSRSAYSNVRANSEIRRLVNANFGKGDKFLTLTFNGTWVDVQKCNSEFQKFIKRLKRYVKKKYPQANELKYFCVLEFQNDYYYNKPELKKALGGNVHYHLICNIPEIDIKIIEEKIWGHGFCWITNVRKVKNTGAYFAKHGLKYDKQEIKRLAGQKKYFRSRNLKKPVIYIDKYLINQFIEGNKEFLIPVYSSTKEFKIPSSEEIQTVKYLSFKLTKKLN